MRPFIRNAVEERVGLARRVASSFWKKSGTPIPLEDLTAAALYGLVQAGHRYDAYCEERGFDSNDLSYFSVYSRKRIHGEIVEYLRSLDWVSRGTRATYKRLAALASEEDYALSDAELAERSGLKVTQVRQAKAAHEASPVALDSCTDADIPTLEMSGEGPYLAAFQEAYATLNADERLFLAYRFYLNKKLRDIALLMDRADTEIADLAQSSLLTVRAALVSRLA